MMIELKKIKLRYDANCGKCGKSLKKDWTAHYSAESKSVYCDTCAEVLQNTPNDNEIPENLHELATLNDISLKIDHINTRLSVIHAEFNGLIESQKKQSEALSEITASLKKPATKKTTK